MWFDHYKFLNGKTKYEKPNKNKFKNQTEPFLFKRESFVCNGAFLHMFFITKTIK